MAHSATYRVRLTVCINPHALQNTMVKDRVITLGPFTSRETAEMAVAHAASNPALVSAEIEEVV